jgi:hypothetical protein
MDKRRPNNSLNRSGDCLSFMFFCRFNVGWIRAARLIRALGGSLIEELKTSPQLTKKETQNVK